MKQLIFAFIALIIIGAGTYFFMMSNDTDVAPPESDTATAEPVATDQMPVEPDEGIGDGDGPYDSRDAGPVEVIGQSVAGADITAYHFGTGETEVLLVGGLHGGYSFNTALLGNELVDHFTDNPDAVPANVRLTIIPVANPDGLARVVDDVTDFSATEVTAGNDARIAARFNANGVDLNRNFNCEWSETSTWQTREVSGGDAPFSEPEARALRDYVESQSPDMVIAYYSAAGGVYASNCRNGVLPETSSLLTTYADASGYNAFAEFDFYEINGDFVNWLAAIGTPGISVLLTDRISTEFAKNLAGVTAVLNDAN